VTSKKPNPSPEVRRMWDRAAKALAARLGLRDYSVRTLTGRIAHGAWAHWYYRDQPNMIGKGELRPDLPTVLDALALIPAARAAVDIDERDLIRAARHLGATWEAIGVQLGAQPSGARQTARGRFARLGGDVNAAVPGAAAETAPELVDGGERVPAPAPAELGPPEHTVAPALAFVEPTLLDVDGPTAEARVCSCPPALCYRGEARALDLPCRADRQADRG
jgi:hypothetical protein